MRDSYDYGILGVGELGAAIVTGLCQDAVAAPGILLSPRSAARAADLGARYPSVVVAPDNQALADRCAVVVLSVRPADAAEVLGKLTFRAGQFEAMSAATATVAAHVRYLAEISRWLSDQGVDPDQASRYVRSVFGAAGQDLAARDEDFGQVTRAFATPGGLNERFSALLAADGVFDSVRRSIEEIYGSL
jgi:pyrroline-5-carboxylate reductase